MNKGEIVIYQTADNYTSLEVRFENDTVWLTQAQMVDLFGRERTVITKHINNVFRENELTEESNVHFLHIAFSDKPVKYYSLDVIISVGYRIKSQRGTQFRIWANNILKNYLLKGYAVNQRFDRIENDIFTLKSRINEFDFQIKNMLPHNEGIFFEGQVYDAWQFVSDLIKTAKAEVVVIDNYVDDSVLKLLSKRSTTVKATIYTQKNSLQFKTDLDKHNYQYPAVELKIFSKSHDRFILIDKTKVYHFGASLKDLGKKWFAFSKMELSAEDILSKLP